MVIKSILTITILVGLANFSFAQFTGGNVDGFSNSILTQTTCSSFATSFVYYGGNNEGSANGLITQSSCTIANTDFVYYGGISDGGNNNSLSQSACTIVNTDFVFYGGIEDGFDNSVLSQTTCSLVNTDFVFYGGIEDGFNNQELSQSTCTFVNTDFVFYGGIEDGFDNGVITQSACPIILTDSVFFGGNNDGFNNGIISQSVCSPVTTPFVFFGGVNDGFIKSLIEQTPCPGITSLPIELLSFFAVKKNSEVDLKWQTATERNSDFFTIEKSRDAIIFDNLGTIKAAGNSDRIIDYLLIDKKPFSGISYYRLRETDFDGSYKYSEIIIVDFSGENKFNIIVFPNPNNGIFNIFGFEEQAEISVKNALGQEVFNSEIDLNSSQIDLSNQASGIYFVKITSGNSSANRKIVLTK